MNNAYISKNYYAMALDPIHIGTGGYSLGRVDNTILREPGTDLPKIPGTSICGVARAFTALKKNKYPNCAGKSGTDGEKHCEEWNCPVCVSYGFSSNSSFHGMAQFFDARILFFPVRSMKGPIWVTSDSIMREFNQSVEVPDDELFFADPSFCTDILNIGWLMLKSKNNVFSPAWLAFKDFPDVEFKILEILKKLVIVSANRFSQIVNDNLEVRTSVAISPETGAAEDKALYTYEAIPRSTILWFPVVYNNPKNFRINGNPLTHEIKFVKDSVEAGLKYFEDLGVGGMNTRGMGRLRILNL